MITKGTDTSAAGMIGAGHAEGLLDGAREMGQEGLKKAAEVSCGREEKTGVTSSAARLEASRGLLLGACTTRQPTATSRS